MLILIAGLPGTGKTTLASAYAISEKVLHLNSDSLRNELQLRGKYSLETKQKVYDELLLRARKALSHGETVVVDSTFHQASVQRAFIQLAEELRVPLCWIEATASESILRERLGHPRPDSEADYRVYEQIRDAADPLPLPRLSLRTDEDSLSILVSKIREYVLENGERGSITTP